MSGELVGVATGYVKLWPREAFYIKQGEQVRGCLNKPGVYILFRDTRVFYVGQAKSLFGRLIYHARKRYTLWNHFSAFLVPENHLDDVEAIVIAATPGTANKSQGKKIKRTDLPVGVRKILLRRREIDPENLR